MTNRSKAKGTAAESAVKAAAEANGIPAVRVALAGSQDQSDVWLWPINGGAKVAVEVKSGEQSANPSWTQIDKWFREAETQAARVSDCDMAVLVCKRKGSGMAGDWFAWVRVSDLNWWLATPEAIPHVTSCTTSQRVMMPLGDLLHQLKVGYYRHHNERTAHGSV
mgnify:FL=1